MTGEISGLSPEHSDHTEPAQGLWGLEPLFLKHFTQPLACSKSPGKASAFFFFFKSYHMSSIASSSPFQYLKGLRTVVHVSSDFAIKGTRGFYKFSESSTLYIFLDTLSLQISFCFYDLSCLWRGLKNSRCPQMCYIKIPPKPRCINAFREAHSEWDWVKSLTLHFLLIHFPKIIW